MPNPYAFAEASLKKCGVNFADFTPEQQECISRKIRIHIDEGMDQEQAVAVAIKKCAPDKAKSSNAAYQSDALPGQGYDADQNPDGTWNIRRVPIYSVHERRIPVGFDSESKKLKYKKLVVDRERLDMIVAHHVEKRDSESFLYPLHINHHAYCGGSPGESVMGAGFFMPVAVDQQLLDGDTVETIFADFVAVKPEVFKLIDRGELPYRSAEILDISESKISSVALMEHHVPYFQYPMLKIRKKLSHTEGAKAAASSVGLVEQMTAAVAYSKGGLGMEEEKKEEKPSEASQETPAEEAAPPWAQRMLTILEQIASKVGGGEATAEKEEEEDEEKKVPVPQGKGAVQFSAEDAAKRIQEAEAKSDLAISKAEALERSAKMRAEVGGWVEELASYNLSMDVRAKLTEKYEKEGRAACLSYVQAVKEHGQAMPTPGGPRVGGGAPIREGQLPKEVLAYQEHGPEVVEIAMEAYEQYAETKEHGLHGGMTREEWIKQSIGNLASTGGAK
jgi:hypothetical protein